MQTKQLLTKHSVIYHFRGEETFRTKHSIIIDETFSNYLRNSQLLLMNRAREVVGTHIIDPSCVSLGAWARGTECALEGQWARCTLGRGGARGGTGIYIIK